MKLKNKPKVAIVRGGFANPWELQNFYPLEKNYDLKVFTSLRPLQGNIKLPIKRLPSLVDLPEFPYKMAVFNRTFGDSHWLWGLEKNLQGFDIAHVAETYYAYTHQALQARKKGLVKKVISTCWEIIPHNNESLAVKKKWKKQAIKEIDHFICPTELAKKCLIKEGCKPRKISIIKMGVDIKKFTRKKITSGLNLLFVGRLEEEKGVGDLLKAFKIAVKKNNKLNLLLVGKGRLGRRNLPGKVFLKNRIAYPKLEKIYKQADIFILPSRPTKTWAEQYGMVLVEAMATGLPIITTDCGAIPEVVGKAAILIKPGDYQALAKKIIYLSENKPAREKLSRQAFKLAIKEYNRLAISQKIYKVYRKVLNEK